MEKEDVTYTREQLEEMYPQINVGRLMAALAVCGLLLTIAAFIL